MSFLGELKRRNVFRVAGVYTVVAWLLVQVAATVEEAISLPPWFDAVVLSFLVIVFPVALIFAWAFELTPDGIKRTSSVDEDESITAQTGSKLDVLDTTQSYEQLLAYFESQFLGDLNLYATRLRSSNLTESPPFRPLAMAARAAGNESLYEGQCVMRRIWHLSFLKLRSQVHGFLGCFS